MKVEFITNASVIIHLADGKQILTDPWFGTPVFYGSWHNFPPLSETAKTRYTGIQPDAIYVSHTHPDHLDRATLKRFPKDTPILIGALAHNHLSRAIAGLGFEDIRALPLDEITDWDGVQLAILSEFEGSGDGLPDDTGYAVDTSLWMRDVDGQSVLHVVDNAIKVDDAKGLRDRFDSPDIALLPYAGASFYPHAFFRLNDVQKQDAVVALRARRLKSHCQIVQMLEPSWVIPAAGSYVMGGRIADYSAYLHQPTPDEIEDGWRRAGLPLEKLCQLAAGDTLDGATGKIEISKDARFRRFTSAERTAYAKTLADYTLPQDAIVISPEFHLPWPRLLRKARTNQWRMQERLCYFPPIDIVLLIRSGPSVAMPGESPYSFRFSLDCAEVTEPPAEREGRMKIEFQIDSSLLLMVLLGAAIWNNVEIAALVECAREPDEHVPGVHSLMSYFML